MSISRHKRGEYKGARGNKSAGELEFFLKAHLSYVVAFN